MTKEQRKKMMEDAEVAQALYKIATEGYTTIEQAAYRDNDGTIRLLTFERRFPPSIEAQVFWLTNRRPENWKVGDITMAQIFGKLESQLDDYFQNRPN
ncbi:MAG: hypothetical protein ACXW00_07605 [Methylobacter sp.]